MYFIFFKQFIGIESSNELKKKIELFNYLCPNKF